VIHNFKQEGQGEHDTKIKKKKKKKKKKRKKEQGKLCIAKSMYTKKGKEIKTCRKR
jgi:hypothetical protein